MTEAEWLANSTRAMFFIAADQLIRSQRKCQLFAVACSRRIWQYLPDEVSKQIIEALDRKAEGAITNHEWENYCTAYEAPDNPSDAEAWIRSVIVTCIFDGGFRLIKDVADGCRGAVRTNLPARRARKGERKEEWAQCDLLRDIFGNPFRSVPFSPSWRTSTVVALASQMYESRDFGAMPILADAIQDAGCDSADVLDHCRGPGPHARGCWVVDLVLEKES